MVNVQIRILKYNLSFALKHVYVVYTSKLTYARGEQKVRGKVFYFH